MVIFGIFAHGCNNYEIFASKSKSLQALGSQCHAKQILEFSISGGKG